MLNRPLMLSATLLASATMGCASLAQLGLLEPEVALSEVQIAGLGFSGGTLNLVLDVYNPNSYEIRGQRMAIDVALNDVPFGGIGLDRNLLLPSREHTTVQVPLQFTWDGVGSGARSLLQTGALPYALRGTLWVDSPLGEHAISVGTDGTVTMRDLIGRMGSRGD